MGTSLRVLIVEDSEGDAVLIAQELQHSGYDLEYERVYAAEVFSAALDSRTWDLIIADYLVPGFGGLEALTILQQRDLDLPFIIVSGVIGEDTAVAAMKAGAYDYVMKDNLARLGPAIRRALQEAEGRRARRQTEETLKLRLDQLAALSQASQAVTASLDLDQVLAEIVSLASKVVAANYTSVVLVDETGHVGPSAENLPGVPALEYRIRDSGFTNLIVRSRRPVVIDRIGDDGRVSPDLGEEAPRFANPFLAEAGVKSFVGLPLMVKDRLLGVLYLHSLRSGAFHDQQSLLTAFANQVAIAVENARLFEETQRRLQELTLLNQIPVGGGAALDLDALINGALKGLHELKDADRTYFVTTDPDARTWETTHELTAPGIEPDTGLSGTFADTQVELATLLDGQPFAVSDIATDPRVEGTREMYRALEVQSKLLVPVRIGKQLRGALGFDYCRERHVWQPDEVRLLEGVARQLELALENVHLFEQVQLRAEELTTALDRLEEADRFKDEFIQNISHELRSPLALIRGYAEMLETGELGELPPEQQKPVAIIARRARMLGDLVQDITLILEAEVNPPEPMPVPLDKLAQAAVEDFQVVVEQAELTLRAEIAPCLPPVGGSPNYLRRVLDNLLGNAIKYTPEGGTITVRLRQEGEHVALEVSDTGVGIPPDQLERIFERFYQVENAARQEQSGIGLGLALVKEIVEVYGGRVMVESQMGEGTTFTALLPIYADPGESDQTHAAANGQAGAL